MIFGGVLCRNPGTGLDDSYSPFQLWILCCMIHQLVSEPVLIMYAFCLPHGCHSFKLNKKETTVLFLCLFFMDLE